MRILILTALILAVAPASAQVPIGHVESNDASVRGSVVLSSSGGATVMSGAQITAGDKNASLKLARGGQVHVCAGGSISITSSNSGHENLIGLNSGAIETDYNLASNADTIMTPDFRLLLAGPGAFHFGISLSQRGDMCVQSLAGNTSSIIVNEQLGEGTHQVKPGEAVVFHNGRVDKAVPNPAQNCGCDPRANSAPKPAVATEFGFPEQQSRTAAEAVAAGKPAPKNPGIALPENSATQPGQVYMQVDAPIVFRGEDALPRPPSTARAELPPVPPVPTLALAPNPQTQAETPAAKPPVKKKWFQRLGSALASVFGGGKSK
jgi:hypothetical protein